MVKNKQIRTVNMLTLGCTKNVVDSEKLLGMLDEAGIKYTDKPENADSLIINTCGFIGPAKEENIRVILDAAQSKKAYGIKKLVVMGCLSERYGDDLRKQIKNLDFVVGVESAEKIVEYLSGNNISCNGTERKMLTPSHYAYVKISEGCNQKCSFCAIPLIRGKNVSRQPKDIESEIAGLTRKGVKEFILIGQDTTYFGKDISGSRTLPELLKRLSSIDGVEWLRLMYVYPSAFPIETLDTIAETPNICKYIDIPLQHISDSVLKSMKRGIGKEKIIELLGKIRQKIPSANIRTTFIVGYPNETDKDFEELLQFVREIKLDRVGVFQYSPEEGTSAYTLGDPIPQYVKEERMHRLLSAQSEISLQKNLQKIGSTFRVLIDGFSDSKAIGRTEHDAPEIDNYVTVTSGQRLKKGDFVNVRIDSATEYDLYGTAI